MGQTRGHPLLPGEDASPSAVVELVAVVNPIDCRAQVGASAVPPTPVGVQSQREVQYPLRRILGRPWQLNYLVGADAPGIDGFQPGQGIVAARYSLLGTVRRGQEVREM